ncbi:MAG: hypothetical protein MJ070_07705 [Lachnospiraceae bacterium]|nr:hypothetical protein [Lachnospiraceae bacterium]
MNVLNIVYLNHIDLTWRRPRYTAGHRDGFTIAPYAEIQEKQLDAGLAFAREGGHYDIEQTASLREYLERNPDLLPEVKEMVGDGRLGLLGGGESVTDSNLPDGESLIRNHFYSRLWLKDTFGVTPSLAEIPDIFGISGGMPTLWNAFGYRGILQYHRVFPGRKPYFRGVSGDTVLFETADALAGAFGMGSFVKSRVCTVCEGTGCPACEGSGFLTVRVPGEPEEVCRLADEVKNRAARGEDATLILSGEETGAPKHTAEALKKLAADCGVDIRFVGLEELALEKYRERLSHEPTEEETDPRAEGNPMGAGCYTTRIHLKQMNRRAESALRCAEALTVLNGNYAPKTFAVLWRRMAFCHFHDAITASHSDDAAKELAETFRQITASANRLSALAAESLAEKIAVPAGEGVPFLVWNPLAETVKCGYIEAPVPLDEDTEGGEILCPDGRRVSVLTVKKPMGPEQKTGVVSLFGDLPAMGYSLFRFFPGKKESEPLGNVIENEYLRVTVGRGSVDEIYDKKENRVIAASGTFAPWITDDGGNLWGRMNSVSYHEKADHPNNNENMLPSRKYSVSSSCRREGTNQIAVIRVTYDRPERQLKNLDWELTLILPDGSPRLRAEIRTSFDARDLKLSAMIMLPEEPSDGCFTREIPLGEIREGQADVYDGQLGHADEWPALRYFREGGLTVCNTGTPGTAIAGRKLTVSLLRNPTQLMCGFGCEDAVDPGEHRFVFSLSADHGARSSFGEGMTLNTFFPAYLVRPHAGTLPASSTLLDIPDTLPLLTLKGAEDGNGIVLRYLGTDHPETLSFPAPVTPVTVLEEPDGRETKTVPVGKFAIGTVVIKS